MAYLALYRKWRPRTFDEVVGQKHISIPILRALEQGRLAHAYLFSGPRGTGKTSMARILAKAVNCSNPMQGNPCNTCPSCTEINNGSSMDVYEIDGASARGVDEIIKIRKSIPTLPVSGNKKVYIIDEVHMLTREAFNALLKTLEEPPGHVLFILATTEPEKIPLTILSRCQRYEFHRISVRDIKDHLLYVSEQASLHLSPEAADLIAVRSEGGLRDALSLLDQCSNVSDNKELSAEIVYNLLGLTEKDTIINLSHHIFSSESGKALQLFYEILQNGKEPGAILRDLLEHFRNIMICKIDTNAPELISYGSALDILKSDSQKLSEPYLDALFASLHKTMADVKRSSSPRMNAEMGLLRLCRIKGSAELDSLAERVENLENKVFSPSENNSLSFVSPLPKQKESPSPVVSKSDNNDMAPSGEKSDKVTPSDGISNPEPEKSKIPEPQSPKSQFIDPAGYPSLWNQFTSYLQQIHRIDIWSCVQKGTLILINNHRVIASLPQQFLVLGANNPGYQSVISDAFAHITGQSLEFHAVLKGSIEESSALEEAKNYSPINKTANLADNGSPDEHTDDYQLLSPEELDQNKEKEPVLSEALKIIPHCDIYKKGE